MPTTLSAMFNNALEVESNRKACGKIKMRAEVDRRKAREETQPTTSSSSSSDVKFEMMLKTMENLIYWLTLEAKPTTESRMNLR